MKRKSFFLAAMGILFLSFMLPSIAQTISVNHSQATVSGDQQTPYLLNFAGIFTFFFLMLGPIKILIPFVKMTKDTDRGFRRKLALRAALISTIGCLVAAFMGQRILQSWHISFSALLLAGGIILFVVALRMVMQMYSSPHGNETTPSAPTLALAAYPLSFPLIITPYGIAMLIILMATAQDAGRQIGILCILFMIMVLNLLTMLFAHTILKYIGVITLHILGSILAVLQVALGIEIILQAFIKMGVLLKVF